MRTIKFRGLEANPYCEELRTFLYGTPLFITNEENYILPNFWDYEGLNKFKVLKKTISQFTGLFDKNGKEIYEGDVIEKHFEKYEVLFHNCEWVFTKLKDYYKEQFYKLNFFDENNFEIIGNIYENPEFTQSSE